jgi:class 3 adenylate cyclase
MRRSNRLSILIWSFHLSLPILGLWLLLTQPQIDVRWEHDPAHFWLVAGTALLNIVLGIQISEAAGRRSDARVFLVSLAFLSSAGFLLLHALATPTILLPGRNPGFTLATPVGLFIASIFAAASAIEFTPERATALMRRHRPLRAGLALLMIAWGVISLFNLPPLGAPSAVNAAIRPDAAFAVSASAVAWICVLVPSGNLPDTVLAQVTVNQQQLIALAIPSVALYLFAALRYFAIHRLRPSVMLIALITAFTLLAESMIAVALSRNWQLSWWLWHISMTLAFGFVAYSARVHYNREGSSVGLFNGVYLEQTIRQIQREYSAALEALVAAFRRRTEVGEEAPIGAVAAQLRERFVLSEGQTEVLERAAEALANEREQIQRLGALVAIGQETSVILDEEDLLRRAVVLAGDAFRRDVFQVGMLRDGRLRFPPDLRHADAWPALVGDMRRQVISEAFRTLQPTETQQNGVTLLILPLTVKGRAVGVLEVQRAHGRFADRDRWLLRSLASQLSIALENARLYRQIDSLFRQYMAPSVATALLADPAQAALGGARTDITVLFADLRGFTTFSGRTSPEEVVALLNRYFGVAAPLILQQGGTIDKFVGDALMALFNTPTRQPDHALRAARAALAMQSAIEQLAADKDGWPRFRVGINSGPAVVGNIGSAELRNFTAIGDTVNMASRLETSAESGQIVIGATTYVQIRDVAVVQPLGGIQVKGKDEPVDAYVLLGLREGRPTHDA